MELDPTATWMLENTMQAGSVMRRSNFVCKLMCDQRNLYMDKTVLVEEFKYNLQCTILRVVESIAASVLLACT